MLSNAAASTGMIGMHFNMPSWLPSAPPVHPVLPPSTSPTSIKVKLNKLFRSILASSPGPSIPNWVHQRPGLPCSRGPRPCGCSPSPRHLRRRLGIQPHRLESVCLQSSPVFAWRAPEDSSGHSLWCLRSCQPGWASPGDSKETNSRCYDRWRGSLFIPGLCHPGWHRCFCQRLQQRNRHFEFSPQGP